MFKQIDPKKSIFIEKIKYTKIINGLTKNEKIIYDLIKYKTEEETDKLVKQQQRIHYIRIFIDDIYIDCDIAFNNREGAQEYINNLVKDDTFDFNSWVINNKKIVSNIDEENDKFKKVLYS